MNNLLKNNLSNKTVSINSKQGKYMKRFLGDDYRLPGSSEGYMKFQDGDNKFRILSEPIVGWEDWTAEKTPVRFRFDQKPDHPIVAGNLIKHFWACIVFNYSNERIQILHITQATIQRAIESYSKDEEWGSPYFYDIKVSKSGKDKLTKYATTPCPHKPVDSYVVECFKNSPCNLEVIFDNGDPFSEGYRHYTPLALDDDEISKHPVANEIYIDDIQKKEIEDLIFQDDNPEEATKMLFLKNQCKSFEEIRKDKFAPSLKWIIARLEAQGKDQAVPF